MVMNDTSASQAYLANGSGQTPLAAFMGSGTVANSMNTGIPAVASFATVCEPCESIVYKEPDPALYTYYVTHGFTVLQSAWKSARYPWDLGFVGEPLAQVYPRMRRFRGGTILQQRIHGVHWPEALRGNPFRLAEKKERLVNIVDQKIENRSAAALLIGEPFSPGGNSRTAREENRPDRIPVIRNKLPQRQILGPETEDMPNR